MTSEQPTAAAAERAAEPAMKDPATTDPAVTERAGTDPAVTDPQPLAAHVSRLDSHAFDPVSAVLGVLATLAGVLALTGRAEPLGTDDFGVWLAAAVIAIGAVLLPWGARGGQAT